MKGKKTGLWLAVAGVLILLNLWRWLPAFQTAKTVRRTHGPAGALDLQFPLATDPADEKSSRNLFSSAAPISEGRHHGPSKSTPTPSGPQPTPTPAYFLMGVVSDRDHSRALVGQGDQVYQVQAGDRLGDAYQVTSIDGKKVELKDPRTGQALTLKIQEPQEATP